MKELVVSVFGRAVFVLLGGLSDLLQHELRDGMGESGSHGQQVRLGLVAAFVGYELHDNRSAVRSGVAAGERFIEKIIITSQWRCGSVLVSHCM